MLRQIPIRNIYYLFLYAWNRLPEGQVIDVSGLTSPDLPNLLCKVLIEGFRQLQRRGIDRQYVEYDEDRTCPRGRMCLTDTVARGLRARGKIACTMDDLSPDVLHNQIIKTTLLRLAKTDGVDQAQHDEIYGIVSGLSEIKVISFTSRDFGRIQLHGNNGFYSLLLRVCAMVHEALMPEPGKGKFRFRDVLAEPQTMGLIFQDFIRNFFRLEQKRFIVKGESFSWPVDAEYGRGHNLIPTMNTDTSLLSDDRVIIVECKWTAETLQRGRLRSDHLYQLNAYMRHHKPFGSTAAIEGLLLYPLIDKPLDVVVRIGQQDMRVRTIDFTTDWPEVQRQLMELLEETAST
jgi:5-methylcytosine-specific restriction enzyme subunit McrC